MNLLSFTVGIATFFCCCYWRLFSINQSFFYYYHISISEETESSIQRIIRCSLLVAPLVVQVCHVSVHSFCFCSKEIILFSTITSTAMALLFSFLLNYFHSHFFILIYLRTLNRCPLLSSLDLFLYYLRSSVLFISSNTLRAQAVQIRQKRQISCISKERERKNVHECAYVNMREERMCDTKRMHVIQRYRVT